MKALFPMTSIAALACEDAGPSYSVIHRSKLKKNATSKGDATKADMILAAGARFGIELDDNAADALFAAAYALDADLFGLEMAQSKESLR